MTANFEQRKRSALRAFGTIVRAGPLAGSVEQQPLMIALDQVLTAAGPDGAVDLAGLADFLRAQGCAEEAITESLLLFHQRQASLGLAMRLPPAIDELPAEHKQRYVERSQAGSTTGSYARHAVVQEEKRAAVPEARRAPVPRKLIAAGAVLGLVGLGMTLYGSQTGPAAARSIVVTAPDGLACEALRANHGALICDMRTAVFEGLGAEQLQRQAAATRAAAGGEFRKVHIRLVETNRIVGSY